MEVDTDMNIKKWTLGLFMLLFMNSLTFSKDFRYEKVIACGPKKIDFFDDIPRIESWQYFYIHTSSNGDFVMLNNDYQYKSFEETIYSDTYLQNGNKTSASLEMENGILKYKLINKWRAETRVRNFMLDTNTMTYTSRISGYVPSMGICWKIDTK